MTASFHVSISCLQGMAIPMSTPTREPVPLSEPALGHLLWGETIILVLASNTSTPIFGGTA